MPPHDAIILHKPEPVTVDHPVFEEIAKALVDVMARTELLAMQLVAIAEVLKENGLVRIEEPTDAPATDASA